MQAVRVLRNRRTDGHCTGAYDAVSIIGPNENRPGAVARPVIEFGVGLKKPAKSSLLL